LTSVSLALYPVDSYLINAAKVLAGHHLIFNDLSHLLIEALVLFQGTSKPFSYELLDELKSLQLIV